MVLELCGIPSMHRFQACARVHACGGVLGGLAFPGSADIEHLAAPLPATRFFGGVSRRLLCVGPDYGTYRLCFWRAARHYPHDFFWRSFCRRVLCARLWSIFFASQPPQLQHDFLAALAAEVIARKCGACFLPSLRFNSPSSERRVRGGTLWVVRRRYMCEVYM